MVAADGRAADAAEPAASTGATLRVIAAAMASRYLLVAIEEGGDGETNRVRVRLSPDAVTRVCDACLPAYDAAHPAFAAERAARAAWDAVARTFPVGAPPAEIVGRMRERHEAGADPPAAERDTGADRPRGAP